MFFVLILAALLPCTATTVTIRGTPVDTGSVDSGNISWDYSTFPALFYKANKHSQLVAGRGDCLYYSDDGDSATLGSSHPTAHVIDEGELIYSTKPVFSKYKVYSEESGVTKVTKFYSLSLFGTSYCAVDNDATILAKILLNQDGSDKKNLKSGEKWEMKNGYSLVMNAVDVDGNKCYLSLYKDDELLDSAVISTEGSIDDRIYTVEEEFGDSSDHVYFLTFVDSIFAGQEDNVAVLKYTWLIDMKNPLTIDSGDTIGNFEVDEANETGLVLSNDKSISISVNADSKTPITDDWFFATSDDGKGTNGGYILYPIKVVTIEDQESGANVVENEPGSEPAGSDGEEEEGKQIDATPSGTDTSMPAGDNEAGEIEEEGETQNTSTPGFEWFVAALSISMAFFLRRGK